MITLNFQSYDAALPFFQQKSNVAFVMLQAALVNTSDRPEGDGPKRASSWVSMNKLMIGFGELESEVLETLNGQQIRVVVLKPAGGKFEIDKDTFSLLRKLWESYRDKNLNYSQARQVAITEKFLDDSDNIIASELE